MASPYPACRPTAGSHPTSLRATSNGPRGQTRGRDVRAFPAVAILQVVDWLIHRGRTEGDPPRVQPGLIPGGEAATRSRPVEDRFCWSPAKPRTGVARRTGFSSKVSWDDAENTMATLNWNRRAVR